jgi:hypothetical protein
LKGKPFDNNKRRETPLPTGLQPTKEWSTMEDNDRGKFEDLDYRSCIGSLIYLMAGTRYDIAYSVTKLATFVNNPGSKHLYALVWLLQYLRSNSEYGLIYYNDYTKSHVYEIMTKELKKDKQAKLFEKGIPSTITFTDASWQDCPDSSRSTSSYIIFHNGGIIDYGSTLPLPISMSSSEAEYVAACLACIAVTHFRYLDDELEQIGKKDYKWTQEDRLFTSIILCDNSGATIMSESPKPSSITRHIERRFKYVTIGSERGRHELLHLSNVFQLADIGTKAVARKDIRNFLDKVMKKVNMT